MANKASFVMTLVLASWQENEIRVWLQLAPASNAFVTNTLSRLRDSR